MNQNKKIGRKRSDYDLFTIKMKDFKANDSKYLNFVILMKMNYKTERKSNLKVCINISNK